jgi:hypothetical protein
MFSNHDHKINYKTAGSPMDNNNTETYERTDVLYLLLLDKEFAEFSDTSLQAHFKRLL